MTPNMLIKFNIALIVVIVSVSTHTKAKMTPYTLHQAWQKSANHLDTVNIQTSFPFLACFQEASEKHKIPLALILAVARGESDFDPKVISKANAIGVMQIQWPGTARHLGIENKEQLFDPCINIEAGTRYLKELHLRYDDINMALAAYNYGPGRIKKTMNWQTLPDGAKWYSEYIYDHLQYVTNQGTKTYSLHLKKVLARFTEPYRAKSMVRYLNGQWPQLTIDWFEDRLGKFSVIASFSNNEQLSKHMPALQKLGFHSALRSRVNQ